jgi:hypothetical protein
MEKDKTRAYPALLALSGLFALAAIVTLLPYAGAPWANLLGYRSWCSFAPISTAGCALLAAATCTLRARIAGPRRKERRSWIVPLTVAVILAASAASFIPSYTKIVADVRSGASLASK